MGKKNKNKNIIKGHLKLNGIDRQLDLKVIAQINLENDKEFIYIEKLPSGDWRLAYTSSTIDDITNLKSIELLKPEEENG